MVDIHSHILPGVDDGPSTLDEALTMLRIAAQRRTTDIVATPHFDLRFLFDGATIQQRAAELRLAAGPQIRIHIGCELHLTPENVQRVLDGPRLYTLNQNAHLLIELSNSFVLHGLSDIFDLLSQAGIVPVIAHPERHERLQMEPEQLRKWVLSGCLVQVTAQSLTGRFGQRSTQMAHRLLRDCMVHFVASDAHDAQDRTPDLIQAYVLVARRYGDTYADALFEENPRAALEGRPVEPGVGIQTRHRWWFLP